MHFIEKHLHSHTCIVHMSITSDIHTVSRLILNNLFSIGLTD